MKTYSAPLRDMRFVLHELASLASVRDLPGHGELSDELVDAILDEADRFATGVLAPLNHAGDREGARLSAGEVITAEGWKNAYRQFVVAGWPSLGGDSRYAGQGLPKLVSAAVDEMWNAANLSFSLCPMLTAGAIEALTLAGSAAQRDTFLPRLVSGEWTGAMALTEPQAGSDLAAIRTRAEPRADGTYRLFGQKIFITYGDHDLAENIVHMVLARLPDAPEGVRGISLFLVPKYQVLSDGSLGTRNDVQCVSLEHKLGIHASPTCVMSYGDAGGAHGLLVGEPHRGLDTMFIMMNEARFAVGLEGLALAERAYQRARHYARERVQGTEPGQRGGPRVAIIRHPDVRRMLMTMKAQVEAMRALAYVVAAAADVSRGHPSADERLRSGAFVALMTPVIKGWCTENANEVASFGVQVHGGVGYIEEAGAAQHLRDARITTIYEGTTAIQANDLVGRKILPDQGAALTAVVAQMRSVIAQLEHEGATELEPLASALKRSLAELEASLRFLVDHAADARKTAAGAVPFLMLLGTLSGGWQMARAAIAAQQRLAETDDGRDFLQGKLVTARFYAQHVLPRTSAYAEAVVAGWESTLGLADDQF